MQTGFKKRIDITGQRFGQLEVIGYARTIDKAARWYCRCDCGVEVEIIGDNLRSGNTTSCGCAKIRLLTKHGHSPHGSQSPEYRSWVGMIARCTREKNTAYKSCGGNGIKVHPAWFDFRQFLADMGPKPSPDHILVRRNKLGNYEPGNCHWDLKLPARKPKRRISLSPDEVIGAGRRFGRLVAMSPVSRNRCRPDQVSWLCRCLCGSELVINSWKLRAGYVASCGCLAKEGLSVPAKSHGRSKQANFIMFYNARARANSKGVPFSISPDDIVIPATCPVLGIPMGWGFGRESIPTLDRIVPERGYVPGNIRVISCRANRLKSDASTAEIRLLLAYMEKP